MYAVPEINGVPGCADTVLRDVLASWGFEGYRSTDGGQASAARGACERC
jgi:hypothetical protein